jgi:hypothetical protein
VRHRDDLVFGKIARLLDARILLEVTRRSQTTRRTSPIRVATMDESASSPIRSAASTPSSIRLTALSTSISRADTVGYASRKASRIGRNTISPEMTGADSVSVPRGAARSPPATLSASSSSARTRRHAAA